MRVLVVHGSTRGGTAELARMVGKAFAERGWSVEVRPAAEVTSIDDVDAVVVGGALYFNRWHRDARRFVRRHAARLRELPVWLFSSGPLPGSSMEPKNPTADPVEVALGPAEGPGSGGRRKLEAAAAPIGPRDHKVFTGAFDRTDPPATLAERVVRIMPIATRVLPEGDFRDWPAIEAWAKSIAATLMEPVPVG